MSDKLQQMIRAWGRSPGDASAPPAPSAACLTFEQAAALAGSAERPNDAAEAHLAACPRCRQLVADFREALAEGPPVAAMPTRTIERRRLRVLTATAAAAVLVLGVAAGVFLTTRPAEPILLAANVGLPDNVLAGMTTKGPRTFATGDVLLFEVRLRRAASVMLVNLDANGVLTVLPAVTPSSGADRPLAVRLPEGTGQIGPYVLTGPAGEETFVVIVLDSAAPDDLGRLWKHIRQAHAKGAEREVNILALLTVLRGFPAEGRVLRIEHVNRAAGSEEDAAGKPAR